MRSKFERSFSVSLHEAALGIFAHFEAHDDEALAVAGGAVDVFDAGSSQSSFSIGRVARSSISFARGAGHGNHHIDHRHLDLRLFFTRQQNDRRRAEQDGRDDDERRQLGVDERRRDAACDAEMAWKWARSWLDGHGLAVGELGGFAHDDLFTFFEAGKHLDAVFEHLAGLHEAQRGFALFGDEDEFHLPALHHGFFGDE
jgi:hypothetical protein